MTKARTDQKQDPVVINTIGDNVYIQIWKNEKTYTGEDENEKGYEYDFYEFVENKFKIDINEVKNNPSKFVNYVTTKESIEDRVKDLILKQEETSQAVQELILSMEE